MMKNKIHSKVKSEEEKEIRRKVSRFGIRTSIIVIFYIILVAFLDNQLHKDKIDYKRASFVYNEYICTQKEYIEELKAILYFNFGDTIHFCEYESEIDSLENALDEMYSVNKRDL